MPNGNVIERLEGMARTARNKHREVWISHRWLEDLIRLYHAAKICRDKTCYVVELGQALAALERWEGE